MHQFLFRFLWTSLKLAIVFIIHSLSLIAMPRNVQTKCDQQVLPVVPVPKVSFLSRKEARKCGHLTSACLDSNDRTDFVTISGERCLCLQHTDDPNYLTKSDNLSLDTCFVGLMSYDYFWVRLFAR